MFYFVGYTYHLDSNTIIPTSSKQKTSEKVKRGAERNGKSLALSKIDELNQLANVKTSKDVIESRADPRFFLFYWYTSTITTTTTSYSSTLTFSLTVCTPAGTFSYSACG